MMDSDLSGHIDLEEFKKLHDIIVKDEQRRAAKIADLAHSEKMAKAKAARLGKYLGGLMCFVRLHGHTCSPLNTIPACHLPPLATWPRAAGI